MSDSYTTWAADRGAKHIARIGPKLTQDLFERARAFKPHLPLAQRWAEFSRQEDIPRIMQRYSMPTVRAIFRAGCLWDTTNSQGFAPALRPKDEQHANPAENPPAPSPVPPEPPAETDPQTD